MQGYKILEQKTMSYKDIYLALGHTLCNNPYHWPDINSITSEELYKVMDLCCGECSSIFYDNGAEIVIITNYEFVRELL